MFLLVWTETTEFKPVKQEAFPSMRSCLWATDHMCGLTGTLLDLAPSKASIPNNAVQWSFPLGWVFFVLTKVRLIYRMCRRAARPTWSRRSRDCDFLTWNNKKMPINNEADNVINLLSSSIFFFSGYSKLSNKSMSNKICRLRKKLLRQLYSVTR